MKILKAARGALACAVFITAGWACAQGPGAGSGPGSGPGDGQGSGRGDGHGVGAGFGMHRGPMERELGPRGDHGHWWNSPRMIQELKLTDVQRKSMDKILLDHREKLIDLRASLDKAELLMQPMMQEDHPNETQILTQIDRVAMARADLEKANARFLLAIRAQLTLDQWKTLESSWRERHDRWDRSGRGMDREQRMDGGERMDGDQRMHRHMGPPPPAGAAPAAPGSPGPPAQPAPDGTQGTDQ